MTTQNAKPRPLTTLPGVMPSTDNTSLATQHFTDASNVRMVNGFPQKIGGYEGISFDNDKTIVGLARSLFSTVLNGVVITLIGTYKRLYSLYGTALTNITPLKTSSTAAANSLATLYTTLANNPITTTISSKNVVIADTSAARFVAGDSYTLSGVPGAVNGIPSGDLNATHVVRSVGTNQINITVATAATSSGAGGSNAVVRKCGLIQVTSAAHGQSNGDRVKISGAADTGGILAATINLEFELRNPATNTFDVMTTGTSSSSVTGGGGASTVFYPQIDAGLLNETSGQGYGMGKYGVGLYGTALISSTALALVRTWFHVEERFANVLLTTPGNQTGLYEWGGLTTSAPVLVSGAPTAINYAFVSNNQVVTLGASGVENRIQTSDTGDRTQWTGSSTNQVFQDDIEGAGRFISHCNVNGVNLLFTKKKTYTFRYLGGTLVWEVKQKDGIIGILSPLARVVVNGVAFWVGENNIYMWKGANIEIVPANSQDQSTMLRYIFDNINRAQLSKNFMWYNEKFNEIWFHWCSANSNEPDKVAMIDLDNFTWTPNSMDRTAAESPAATLTYPRMIDSSSNMFYHEKGVDADGAALSWSITTNDKTGDENNAFLASVIPDSIQVGDITVAVTGRRFPQSTALAINKSNTVTPTTERIPSQSEARFWRYTFSGSAIGQSWRMGQWFEELQKGARS